MTVAPAGGDDGERTPATRPWPALILFGLATIGFILLGDWQVHRRALKLDLIARVERHLHAAPVAAPGPAAWPAIDKDDAYLRVRATGILLNDRQTLVKALTDLGGGYWVMTPLRTADSTILVNRGFVPDERRDAASRPAGAVTITGLLRLSEPNGGFLRANDPGANRWYSRDASAIARARGLGRVAPYFIDADATPNPSGLPVGGQTVIRFPNNHLVYLLTWYALAMMCAVWVVRLWRQGTGRPE